jgi:hypothetical protein
MASFRRQLMQHRLLALWLLAAALAMKLLIPAGFMPVFSAGTITIELCGGHGSQTVTLATADTAGHHGDRDSGPGKSEVPCAFAGLSVPSLAGADPILLVLAIAFIMGLGYLPRLPFALGETAHLRPPTRGPPLTA